MIIVLKIRRVNQKYKHLTEVENATILGPTMPNKHASIKDLRKSKKRTIKNALMKTHVKALARKLKDAVEAGKKAEAKLIAGSLQQAAAKAAKTHVLHNNKAHRIGSAAMQAVAKLK